MRSMFGKLCIVLAYLAAASVASAATPSPLIRSRVPSQKAKTPPAGPVAASVKSDDGSAKSFQFSGTLGELLFNYSSLPIVSKSVIKDPSIEGDLTKTVAFNSPAGQKLEEQDVKELIETLLEMYGIHLEPYGENGKFIRAISRKAVRKEGIPLVLKDETFAEEGKVVSTILSFKVISAEVGEKILKEFLSDKSGPMQVFKHTNSILVTDTMQNINRMREILKEVDCKPQATKAGGEWYAYVLKYATAANVEKALQAAYEYDKKRIEEMNKALEKPETTGGGSASATAPSSRPRGVLGTMVKNAQTTANAPASVVAGTSPFVEGMLPTPPLFLFDEENAPNKLIVFTTPEEKKIYDKIVEQLDVPSIPDKVVKVYRLKYAEAEDVSDMINDLINKSSGSRSRTSDKKANDGGKPAQPQQTARPAAKQQQQGEAKVGELTPENTQVLADKRINGLVVQTHRALVPTIEQIIESMDIKLSQVLIETVIIEVTLGDGLNTGMDWVQHGRKEVMQDAKIGSGETAQNLYYKQRTTTTYKNTGTTENPIWEQTASATSYLEDLVAPNYSAKSSSISSSGDTKTEIVDSTSTIVGQVATIAKDGFLNYYTAGTATGIAGGQGGQTAYNLAHNITSNVLGNALNFVFTSDELGLTAILTASKTDSRTKYVASPIIMTLDNKEATIDATSSIQFLTGWQAVSSSYAGSGLPSPTYSSKDVGIKVKVTPKINPNGTVMLTVEEEYTQVAGTQDMLQPSGATYVSTTIDVPTTRKMQSDVILENNQTVVFGGLTQTQTHEEEKGVPILKDIPFIGKWLFGTVKQSEDRTELLVFMTPYVLNDAQAAQYEALRRKKTMSDSRAWDDHGWSLSELADPISQKEQMRRLKDEWKKQDEERQTKIEIEKAKVERAKKLQEMSKEERDLWLKMHKEELEKEQQEELEKKMQDKESQEELKKLAEQIKADKLKAAEKEIKESEKDAAALNERAKLDAEKKAKEEVEKVGGGGEGAAAKVEEKKEGDAK